MEVPTDGGIFAPDQHLEGGGSRFFLQDCSELRAFVGNCLWSPSCFAASCGGASIEIVRNYVANQRSAT